MNLQSIDSKKKTGKLLFEIGILIIAITAVTGLGIYQAILSNWRVGSDGNVFFQAFIQSGTNTSLTYLNQQSLYIRVLSVFFSFLGNKEELVLVINLILQLLGIVFFFYGAKNVCSYKLSFIILFAGILTSIAFYPLNIDTPMHLIWMLCAFILWICTFSIRIFKGQYFKYFFPGVIIGISCYVDLAGFYLFATILLLLFCAKGYSIKDKILQFVFYLLFVVNGFFVMFYLWNNLTFHSSLLVKWFGDKMVPFLTFDGIYQNIAIGGLLVFCVIFRLFTKSATYEMPEEKIEATNVVSENTNTENAKELVEEMNIINASLKEEKEEEDVKQINFIPNPLPLPKKHVKKEMHYAFEPSPEMMHYDYNNYRFDDDYDLKEI